MKFTKMESAGNDFIIIDNTESQYSSEKLSQIAKEICQRRTSIGADTLIAIQEPETDAELKIRMFSPDGSTLEMCSNGIRCAARYAFEHHMAGEAIRIESCGKHVNVWKTAERCYKMQLDPPNLAELENVLDAGGEKIAYAYLDFGGMPHAVIKYKGLTLRDVENERLLAVAKGLRYSQRYPRGVNVNFYDSVKESEATVITYERGVETFTPSCGLGASAVAMVMMLQNETSSNVLKIQVPMGEFLIEADINQENRKASCLYLSGDTRMIAEGKTLED
jgi:diaminopimelate epimerase